jgi:hypothetical protein
MRQDEDSNDDSPFPQGAGTAGSLGASGGVSMVPTSAGNAKTGLESIKVSFLTKDYNTVYKKFEN